MRSMLTAISMMVAAPTFVLAQTFSTEYPLSLVNGITTVLGALFPLMVAIAVLYFVWGVVVFIGKAGDEKARIEGKRRMVWGIVSLFVIISVWGFVAVLQGILQFGGDTPASRSPQASFGGGPDDCASVPDPCAEGCPPPFCEPG